MANPFLGEQSTHVPSQHTDPYGHDRAYACHRHVAGFLVLALGLIIALQMTGFRAMVGIGR